MGSHLEFESPSKFGVWVFFNHINICLSAFTVTNPQCVTDNKSPAVI